MNENRTALEAKIKMHREEARKAFATGNEEAFNLEIEMISQLEGELKKHTAESNTYPKISTKKFNV